MKPSFALNLSHDGLSLLRRAKGGWQVFGSVDLDDPDLTEKLGYLRKTAAELASGQLASKLVIPNSEILYRTVTAPGSSDEERAQAVRAALEDATPYAVDDLAFDWVDAGDGMVHVAAVARDTLDEAETFATEHRFNPVSFVAIPKNGAFVGEPFFGETGLCSTVIPDGDSVESDAGPIVIVGDHDPDTAPETSKQVEDDKGPHEDNDPQVSETAVSHDSDEVDETEEKIDAVDNEPDKASVTEEDAAQVDTISPNDGDESNENNIAGDVEPTGMFATRRGSHEETEGFVSGLERVTARFALYAGKNYTADATAPTLGSAPSKTLITPMAVTDPEVASEILPASVSKSLAAKEKTTERSKPGHLATPANFSNRRQNKGPDRQVLGNLAKANTIFDVQKAAQVNEQPKLFGISMTFGLVALVLLGILVSSFLFDRPIAASRLWNGFDNTNTQFTSENLTEPQIVATTIEPLVQPEATPTDSIALPGENIELAALNPADEQVLPDTALNEAELAETNPEQPPLGEISIQEAIVIQASTGVWVLAPIPPVDLQSEVLEEFYVASIDRQIISQDAIALPATGGALNDYRLGEMASPPAPGIKFDLDENGFVRATRAGAISPEGVIVTLGKPKTTPYLRPIDAPGFEPVVTVALELPRTRPTLRPANLIKIDERARLGGRSRLELAAHRPTLRPASPQDSGPELDLTPTKLAVLSSRSPTTRPNNFTEVVAAARSAAQTAAVENAVASVAVAAPSAPTIPTTASVAREATIDNAINLSKVNLIGVYGSSSDRRALVRLKNGRYVKVQIGDRLDGGKVAAIDGTKLQYIKGGRMVTLDIAS